MDVRCDRCQTEYDLDDESVAEGGASVQCTSCGNTFVVGRERRSGTPAPVVTAAGGAPTSSWMLTTEEGKTHRFRDSTTLQKWVVERRVGRADRVSPPGGGWRRLGDIDELRPFFDVVDQADRAALAARARPTRPETPRATSQARAAYVSPDADDDDILTSGAQPRRATVSDSFSDLSVDDDLAAAGLGGRHVGRKLAVGALVVLAGLAAYLGFKGPRGFRLPGSAPAASDTSAAEVPAPSTNPATPLPAAAPPAPAPASTVVPAAPTPAAPVAAAPIAGAPAAAAPAATIAAAAPAAAPVAAAPAATIAAAAPAAAPTLAAPAGHPAEEPAQPITRAPASPRAGAALAEAGRPRSYEQLVADADHALENGQTTKAHKLYDEALKLQPNGVEAVTGAAYLLLDRQRPLAAIDMFKRALNNAPSFSQALFGLGEAYRQQGQPGKAVEAYQRYLELSPTGSDAPAARRQMRELESQATAAQPLPGAPAPSSAPTSPPPQL
jgi:predicted Zn finger-like uncharacterized protein